MFNATFVCSSPDLEVTILKFSDSISQVLWFLWNSNVATWKVKSKSLIGEKKNLHHPSFGSIDLQATATIQKNRKCY